jgi:hypothetical protein
LYSLSLDLPFPGLGWVSLELLGSISFTLDPLDQLFLVEYLPHLRVAFFASPDHLAIGDL